MNNLSGKILAVVMSLFLVGYVGYQVYRYLYSPIKTESVQQYTIEDMVYAQGIAIRDEIPVEGVSSGVVSYFYDDGVRVITGTAVAQVHSSRENVQNQHRLEEIDDEIGRLASIEKTASSVVNVSSISDQIEVQLDGLIEMNRSGDLQNAQEICDDLQDVLNKKAVAIRDVTDFSDKISRLENEKATLQNQMSTDIGQITSPAYGYFGSYCDTASDTVTTALLTEATVSQLEELASSRYEQNNDYAGKVILGYTWYYAALVSAEDAKKFSVGMVANLYFGSSTSEAIPGTVIQLLQDDSSEKTAVIFSCDYMSQEISRLRNSSARIELGTYQGLKIPYRALRFQDGLQGVYVLSNQALEFKKVDILYQSVGFFISSIDSNNKELVQLYDDIVTEGTDLYDGKAVNS
ncbi:MAG: HlyD family efflux transporter periplasmic adaptor subunit [Oscillospiraceae bacterium]|nr:HlyD family efflux transporter periplasmic adaptor subunit [Oscillospiraceae bacterium]